MINSSDPISSELLTAKVQNNESSSLLIIVVCSAQSHAILIIMYSVWILWEDIADFVIDAWRWHINCRNLSCNLCFILLVEQKISQILNKSWRITSIQYYIIHLISKNKLTCFIIKIPWVCKHLHKPQSNTTTREQGQLKQLCRCGTCTCNTPRAEELFVMI